MTTFLLIWYSLGWASIGMRRYSSRNYHHSFQTLNVCELVLNILGGGFTFFAQSIGALQWFIEHGPKCPEIKTWGPR